MHYIEKKTFFQAYYSKDFFQIRSIQMVRLLLVYGHPGKYLKIHKPQ